NLLFLWIFGDNVEARLGSVPFLLFYLVCGAAATGLYALLAGPSLVPLVGASGAISGVLGAYLLWFPHNRVKLFVGLWPIWLDIILVPAWVVLGSYLVLDNVLPLLLGAGGNVAYGAHVGGFLAGLAVAGALGRSRAAGLEGGEREISLGRSALKAGDLAGAYQHLIRAAQDPSPVVRERALRELAKIPDPRLQAWIASLHQV
ncbi:MAG: rhomboid family intramembrane serine protease, partial [Myxococcales bacterium]|nr:rhomboid family intramembrane serine protease [Myxococcales bacterium]